ncbi:MAG: regulatory protein RecX [Bacteroidetes bacterium]|nr:regulatory protein RecX [Bacteroidota bacterium]
MNSEILNKKLQQYCAYQERCTKEIVSKLKDWNLRESQIESVIANLKKENILNEERFARAFTRGKFRVNKWGKLKIAFELQLKSIPDSLIRKGLSEIDEEEYLTVLKTLILKKKEELDKEKGINLRDKIITFIQNKGYELPLIFEILMEHKI